MLGGVFNTGVRVAVRAPNSSSSRLPLPQTGWAFGSLVSAVPNQPAGLRLIDRCFCGVVCLALGLHRYCTSSGGGGGSIV